MFCFIIASPTLALSIVSKIDSFPYLYLRNCIDKSRGGKGGINNVDTRVARKGLKCRMRMVSSS